MRDDDERRRRRRTREDNATQPLDAGRLSFAILCLREENSQLKRLRDIIGDSDDDDEDDGDARKNWSELSRSRKKQLLGKISTQMSKLAGERGTGVVNIAASLIARFQIIISI